MRSLHKQITLQLLGILLLSIALFAFTGILLIARNEEKKQLTQSVRIQAAGGACSGDESDFQGCSNGGDLRNGCNWICNSPVPPGVALVPPPCCEVLAQTGDPFACCFDARRRCTPQQCAAIPEGVPQQRCAQLWVLGYCSPPSATPRPTSTRPSNTPRPTQQPTRRPTRTPTRTPTRSTPTTAPNNPTPTTPTNPTVGANPTTPVIPTTTFQTGGQQFTVPTTAFQTNHQTNQPDTVFIQPQPITFKLPEIAVPQLDVAGPAAQTVETLDRQLPRSLDFFEYLFLKVQEYDRKLEEAVHTHFSLLGE